ncbi:MAG: type IV toxin-antitoxin system AbiEi family antitoxin domain-containing protein [Candidatus Binataceae bacterium]
MAKILSENRSFWRLTTSMSTQKFIEFLLGATGLSKIVFPFPPPYNRETRYVWGNVPLSEVILSLRPHCHFSHYTAVQIHGLTEQIPKTIYVNFEQPLASNSTAELSQKNIDVAFKRKVRTTNYVAETPDFRVCMLNGKNTGYLGVEDNITSQIYGNRLGRTRVTNIERTLIDIAVRPIYSGGVYEVLKAYRLAQPQLSINRLTAMLQALNYIYPYHQVIGFYLERAAYGPTLLDLLRRFPMKFDFYLTHQMGDTDYIADWRLYIPKGF